MYFLSSQAHKSTQSVFCRIFSVSAFLILALLFVVPLSGMIGTTGVQAEESDTASTTGPSTTDPEPDSQVSPTTTPAADPDPDPVPTIETGDADAVSDTETKTNVTDVDTETENATTTPGPIAGSTDVTVSASSTALIDNDVAIDADTGGNAVSGGGGSIETGNAYAGANVVNLANATIIDSDVLFLFLNSLFGYTGDDVDLREFLSAPTSGTTTASCGGCLGGVVVNATSSASVDNSVIVRSNTGSNTATGTNSSINTGNAYAEANVVNVVNANIIDASYFLFTFNGFGLFGDDIILPGLDFFESFFFGSNEGCAMCLSQTTVQVANEAIVSNTSSTSALSGENTASGSDSHVETGNVVAATTIVNNVNENYIESDSFRLILRVHGNWSGNLYSLPPGLIAYETPFGLEITVDPAYQGSGSGVTSSASRTINTNASAVILNDTSVEALTGGNNVVGNNSSVETGMAAASTNVVNTVNTNIIGRNWLLAIVNIFGDWTGNIAFGRPDLWLGTRIGAVADPIPAATGVELRYTVVNRGDAPATNVWLSYGVSNRGLALKPDKESPTGKVFIGTLMPKERRDVVVRSVVRSDIPAESSVDVHAYLTAHEPDADNVDNGDVMTLALKGHPPPPQWGIKYDPEPEIVVVKRNFVPAGFTAPGTADYEVVIRNDGGPAYHSVLVDTVKDAQGTVIDENFWELGTIYPNEEITVSYSVNFNESTSDGLYINEAVVHSIGRHPSLDPFYGYFFDSNVASSTVKVVSEIVEPASPGVVLIVATTTSITTRDSSSGAPAAPRAPAPVPEPRVNELRSEHPEGPHLILPIGDLGSVLGEQTYTGGFPTATVSPVHATQSSTPSMGTGQVAAIIEAGRSPFSRESLLFLIFVALITTILLHLPPSDRKKLRRVVTSMFSF